MASTVRSCNETIACDNVGRDHWPHAMSMLVAGGGRKRGDVIGATNSRGEHPITRRYDPHDFLATIYNYSTTTSASTLSTSIST